jgi:HSP20 family protein
MTRREHPLQRLQRDFDTLFDRLWGGMLGWPNQDIGSMRLWDFGVTENDREVVVRAEVPGFEENELDVRLDNNVLTVQAEKQQKEDGQEEYRSFNRSVTLPPGVDAEKAQATYRNGVLELHIPRAESARPRRIAIQGQQGAGGSQRTQARPNQSCEASSQTANQSQQAGNQAAGITSSKARK